MPPRDFERTMWTEACEMLERAERLHRQFFQPTRSRMWEPPIDVYETEREFWIVVALPGVAPEQVEVVIDGGLLLVAGERRVPIGDRAAIIHRLEVPHGRFERRIELPSGRLALDRRDIADGCLTLTLRKL